MRQLLRTAAVLAAAAAVGSIGLSRSALADPAPAFAPQPGDIVAGPEPTGTGVIFHFITSKGSVRFDVLGNWPTVAMQPLPPIAAAAFQIPNPADAGTSDSTNVAYTIFSLDDDRARAARAKVGKQYGSNPPTVEQYHGWTISRQEANQGSTTYTMLDGVIGLHGLDADIAIRLAWPHLVTNAPDYDATMEQLYRKLLDSVSAESGPYTPGQREVVRRFTPNH
jgi:hypothetical protein